VPRGIEYSLHNAIVLLILALGKVCSYKEKVPLSGPALLRNSTFCSDSSGDSGLRNVDIMPEMAYYATAVPILMTHQGGQTIGHAQAFILASLYVDQFARVLESWTWVDRACNVMTILVKQ
jgi:hypothetical protein